jgi:hypothetical protein
MNIAAVKKLSKPQKIELMELLWSDLFGDNNSEISDAEKQMLDERAEFASKHPDKLKSVEEVFNKLLKNL